MKPSQGWTTDTSVREPPNILSYECERVSCWIEVSRVGKNGAMPHQQEHQQSNTPQRQLHGPFIPFIFPDGLNNALTRAIRIKLATLH